MYRSTRSGRALGAALPAWVAMSLAFVASPAVAWAADPIAIRWNPAMSQEEFGVLSTTNGAFTFRGVVGDLATWAGQSFMDNNTLYVTGTNSGGNQRLYVLNATTGASINAVNIGNSTTYYLGGRNSAGELITIWWDGAAERFGVMNTTTGAVTNRGVVGNLATWNGQSRMSGNTMYVFGNSSGGTHNLYVLDTVAGTTLRTVDVGSAATYYMAGLNSAGELVVIWYDSGSMVERFGVMNTTTGAVTPRGVVGDLATWSGQSQVDGNTLHVIGNGASATNIYILNSTTGALVDTVDIGTSHSYYLAKYQPAAGGGGDLNADGYADVLWRNYATGDNAIWCMTGATHSSTILLPATADTSWRIVGTGDFDGDGDSDIVWRHGGDGRNAVWFMEAGAKVGAANLMQAADVSWKVVGVGDFDGDDDADLLWRKDGTLQMAVWIMNGTTFSSSVSLPTGSDPAWRVEGAADMNTDGKVDIVWRNGVTGANAVWLMNGTVHQSSAVLPATTDQGWVMGAFADYDQDGDVDIVWRHSGDGRLAYWYMNGTTFVSAAALPSISNLSWEVAGP